MLCRAERARERAEFDAGHLKAYLMCTLRAAEVGAAQADGSARGVATSPPIAIVGTWERGTALGTNSTYYMHLEHLECSL